MTWPCAVCGAFLQSHRSFSGHFRHQHPGQADPGRELREAARFWQMVDVRGDDDCWPWTGAKNTHGYGDFRSASRNVPAHRFALAEALGRPIAPDMRAIHSCDNPPCVNPRHLREGTAKDNTADMMSRGRHRYEAHKGEQANGARLSEADVMRIRSLVAAGDSLTACARLYGMSLSAVHSLVTRKTWRHVA